MYYRPCVDVAFNSAADVFTGKILTLILTGMGEDGKEGVKKLKAKGCRSWAQNEQSSIVYGMPKAICDAGLADKVLNLEDISKMLISEMF